MAKQPAVSASKSKPYSARKTLDLNEVSFDSKAERLVHVLVEKYGELNTIIEAEAKELFCICQKEDADCGGDMIECSNGDQCKDRWFHFKCIGMVQIPGEKDDWFCDYCVTHRWGKAGQWHDTLHSLKSNMSTFDMVPASADLGFAIREIGTNSESDLFAVGSDGMNHQAVSSTTLTSRSHSSEIKGRLSLAHSDTSPQSSRKPWKKSELARLSKEMSLMIAHNETGTVDSWERVAKRLEECGIFRTGNGCKIAWARYLKRTEQNRQENEDSSRKQSAS